jgi:plasmid segregation protein ParM
MKIGIDVGYGYTKVVYGDYLTKTFPSVVTKANILEIAGLKSDYGKYMLEYEGEKVFVGDAAARSGSKFIQTAFEGDRLESKVYKQLMLCGIASCLTKDSDVEIITGLPVSGFKLYRDSITEFKGRHFVKINGTDIVISIKDIKCIPQPVGTYIKLSKEHCELLKNKVLIVDIGFKTTDLLLVDHDIPLPDSTTINYGMSDISRVVVDYVNSQTDSAYSINQADEFIKSGYVKTGTRMHLPEDVLQNAKEGLFDAIWNRIKELYPQWQNFDRLVFTGGTSLMLIDQIKTIPAASIILSSDTQLANAIGYRDILEG